ncbi:hypothetical protein E1B28_004779 [Marasmius oreades]|uniref:Uncharacterized protein n=1 Tax=Marasmius oreades TaxID=181124 RepID=A0A9P7UZB1_9AGAR|nr:uncharacterized protein E1B28_004779 [Marasmius oreades]KAG7097435.1 hypothetical protein E1B28_004779 [Marasmius oreades]
MATETEGTSSLLIFLTTASVTTLSWFFLFPHTPTLPIPFLFKTPRISHSKSTSRTIITNLLLLHTLFILHRIILLAPPNLFTRLGLSVGTPTDAIRSLLLAASPDGTLPERVEMLLKRLGSAEMRIIYVKFGHETLSACVFCSTYFDFALYAFTGVFLEYLREAAVIGLVTIKSTSLERYRSVAIGVLIAAAAGEAYWLTTVGITIPREGKPSNPVMWYDVLTLLRQLLFLFLPLIVHFILPPSPLRITQEILNSYNPTVPNPSSPGVQLPPAITTMHDLINRLQLLRYSRGAFGRIGSGSSSTQDFWWAREREMGAWVREDEDVKKVAKGLGMDYQQTSSGSNGENAGVKVGELRANARRAVGALFRGFAPSTYWTPSSQR